MNNLFPNVLSQTKINGEYIFENDLKIYFLSKKVNAFNINCFKEAKSLEEADIVFKYNSLLKKESYHLIVNDKITIEYLDDAGAFYSMITLAQLAKNKKINRIDIYDEPQTKIRGFMLDISRNKVPTLATIKKIIDLMAGLKMNQLEFYVEGFSFEYQSFKQYLQNNSYITLKEYQELEKYANDRFIDLVPNQNGLGHMTDWLSQKELLDLAVCPEGINMWGRWRKPSTLDPLDPKSLELVKKMYKDMLPHSKSNYFNMNLDEPFELGYGKSLGKDKEQIYLDFVLKLYDEAKSYHKTPMMWGDVLIRHDDLWNKLPKDMIFLDWGYDGNYSFRKNAQKLHEKDVKFMCAPGTSSWSSFFGRYIDWYDNIRNAIDACYDFKGEGVILTDWGDFGHLQFWSMSLAPLIYMGLYSWSHKEGLILSVRDYLNVYLGDNDEIIGDILLDLANYYRYDKEYTGNGTRQFYTFMWASCSIDDSKRLGVNPIDYFVKKTNNTYLSYPKFKMLNELLDNKFNDLCYIKTDGKLDLVVKEIKQTILIVKMISYLSIAFNENVNINNRLNYINYIIQNEENYLNTQKILWLERNKYSDLDKSLDHLHKFFEFVKEVKLLLAKRGEQQ